MEEGEAAALLREVCAAVLATGECDPELAGWCVRMLTEPGAAERAVKAVGAVAGRQHDRSPHENCHLASNRRSELR